MEIQKMLLTAGEAAESSISRMMSLKCICSRGAVSPSGKLVSADIPQMDPEPP
jgi:hypothetical protein